MIQTANNRQTIISPAISGRYNKTNDAIYARGSQGNGFGNEKYELGKNIWPDG